MEFNKKLELLLKVMDEQEEQFKLSEEQIELSCRDTFIKADEIIEAKCGKKKRKRSFLSSVAVLSILVGISISIYSILNLSKTNDLSPLNAIELTEASDEIKLYTAGEEVSIENNAVVKYSESGDIISKKKEQDSTKRNYTKEQKEVKFNRIVVPRARFVKLVLSDGTIVHVNSGSQLIYSTVFDKNIREVALEGEAYFEVKKDNKRPFRVITDKTDIRVLGTSFNVRNYASEQTTFVTLVEGSVEFKDSAGHYSKLSPSEQGVISEETTFVSKVNVNDYIQWINQIYVIPDNQSFGEVLDYLSNYYGLHITYNEEISERRIRGKLDLKLDLPQLLNSITKTLKLKWKHENDTYEIY